MANWSNRLVHYQFLSEMLRGQRVLEIGGGHDQLAHDFLQELAASLTVFEEAGAGQILSAHPEDASRRRAGRGRAKMEFVVGALTELPFREEPFAVILVPELEKWRGRENFLGIIKRLLAPTGIVAAMSASGDGLEKSARVKGLPLQDVRAWLAEEFSTVRLYGEMPFWGAIVADFNPPGDEVTPQLDCSLVDEDEAPRRYLAIAGPAESVAQAPEYCVLQTPRLEVAPHFFDEKSSASEEELVKQWRELAQQQRLRAEKAEKRADELLARLQEETSQIAAMPRQLAELQAREQADKWRIDELTGQVRDYEAQLEELKKKTTT